MIEASGGAARRITILLCTYNGVAHLADQLGSYLAQEHEAWDLWVSDDGSSDGTLALLEDFRAAQAGCHEVRILRGPGRGSTANYLSLLTHPELPPGPVAFSDQDDVWLPEKLSRAVAALSEGPEVMLYGAQSLHAARDLRVIGRSRPPRRAPSFGNALVQNIVSGHSAVLSAGGLRLLRQAGAPEGLPYHDWWLYQVVSGAGGRVVIDPEPVLYYRQHGSNVMGAHQGPRASLARLGLVFGRGYGAWLAANRRALLRLGGLLTAENRALLERLEAAPPGLARLAEMRRAGLRRQGGLGTGVLWLAAALGRI